MKKNLLFAAYAIGLQLFSTVHAQGYLKLASNEVMYIDAYHKAEGLKFFVAQDTSFHIKGIGGNEKLHLKKLEIYNTAFTRAQLVVEFEAEQPEDPYLESPGDFFITISFFDEDKNCLFSEELVSVDGMRLDDGPVNLKEMKTEILPEKHFKYSGSWDLGIHQAFLYSANNPAGGIKGVKYFTVNVYHLGAG